MFNTDIKLENNPEKIYELIGKIEKYCSVMRHVERIKEDDKNEVLCYNMMDDADTVLEDLAARVNDEIIKYVKGE